MDASECEGGVQLRVVSESVGAKFAGGGIGPTTKAVVAVEKQITGCVASVDE